MATFPPTVSQGNSPQGQQSTGGAPLVIKLAMLSQAIQSLAQQFPQAQDGIQMMMKGLQRVQASAASSASPQQPPTPPR